MTNHISLPEALFWLAVITLCAFLAPSCEGVA